MEIGCQWREEENERAESQDETTTQQLQSRILQGIGPPLENFHPRRIAGGRADSQRDQPAFRRRARKRFTAARGVA